MEKYIIYNNGVRMEASPYQCSIFDAIEHRTGNMVINAAAGSAKTTTIVNAIRYIPEKKKVLFVAFNKEIVKKIKENVTHANSTILTFHSLGYYFLLENGIVKREEGFINEHKYSTYIREHLNELSVNTEKSVLKKEYKRFVSNLIKLTDYSRYYLCFTEKEIRNVADMYGITLLSNETEICREILKWGKRNITTIDYTDMLWLPNVLNLSSKKHTYDWIFVDEAQDTNIAEQELLKKCFKRGTRFAIVCDNYQQINIWAGSTTQAIDNFKSFPNTKEYRLPISYRCPKKIVELAKQYSDNIVASDSAIEGEINYDVPYSSPLSGDMVLCRMTAPLIQLFLKYTKLNKKSYIKGYEGVKEEYLSVIKSLNSKIIDKSCLTSDGLFPKIYSRFFEHLKKAEERYSLTFEEAMENSTILSEYDMIEGIKVLSEGLLTVDELVNRINTIFSGTNNEGIALSTIHKAKGLESDNVYILYPSLLNPRKDLKDWEKIVERNLTYVAYTRAKKTLNFIKEDYSNKFLYNNDKTKKEIKDNIIDIMKKLNFNIENKITENNTIRSQKVQKHLGDRSDGFTYTLEHPSETKKKTPLKKFKFI